MLNMLLSLLTLTSLCGSLAMQGMEEKNEYEIESDGTLQAEIITAIKNHAQAQLQNNSTTSYRVANALSLCAPLHTAQVVHRSTQQNIFARECNAEFLPSAIEATYTRRSSSIIELTSEHGYSVLNHSATFPCTS